MVPSCGPCCGGTETCHCCDHISNIPGWGYFQQWDITFNSSAPSPFTSTTVRVYKVAGEPIANRISPCKWESEDGLVRVFMYSFGDVFYNYALYADGADDDFDPIYLSTSGGFEFGETESHRNWCREETDDNPMDTVDDPYIDDFDVAPVTGTWVGCVPP